MECPICLEDYNTEAKCPMILECGHSICAECLKKFITNNHMPCSICRTLNLLPFENYKKNFSLIEIINIKQAELKSSIENQVLCLNSHELSYEKQSSLIYYTIYKESLLKCAHCKKTWEGDSWHCFYCRFILCKSCYEHQSSPITTKITSLNLFSHPHHVLYNYLNAESYVKFHYNTSLNCSICNIRMIDKALGCRLCNFYICENCEKENPYIKGPLCNSHNIELQQISLEITENTREICDTCKKNILNNCYKCPDCDYKLCEVCYEFYTTHYVFDFQCENNHPLYLTNPIKYYNSMMTCNSCDTLFGNPETKMFHCRKCTFDICVNCFEVFKAYNKDKNKVLCYYKHCVKRGNEMENENENENERENENENERENVDVCIVCRKENKKFLLFYCEECEEYFCPMHTWRV